MMNTMSKQKRAKKKEKVSVKTWLSAIAMSHKMFAALRANAATKDRIKAYRKAASAENGARQAMNLHDKVNHQTKKTRRDVQMEREKAAKWKAGEERASRVREKRASTSLKCALHPKKDGAPTFREDEIMSAVV